MSDFDEEAERERLRKQYEADERKREATERMSDLLLKGATMTNAHCEECGSPIFRYEGQEFCPTCGTPKGGAATGQTSDEAAADQPPAGETVGDQPSAGVEAASGEPDTATRQPVPEPTESGGEPAAATREPAADARESGTATREQEAGNAPATEPTAADRRSGAPAGESSGGSRPAAEPVETVADARASLERTVSHLVREAEESEDLGRKREYLAAAREAAEALAALRRT